MKYRTLIRWVALVVLAVMLPLVSVYAQTPAVGSLDYGSAFQLQNLSGNVATVEIEFFEASTGSLISAATVQDTIDAHGTKNYFAVQVDGLPDSFQGSAVVSSTEELRAISNLYANSFAYGAASAGYNDGATTVNLPLIMRNNSGYSTWVSIQNAGGVDAIVEVEFAAGPVGSSYTTAPITLKPGAAKVLDQSVDAALGTKFIGAATVRSTNGQPLVATAVEVGPTILFAYEGFSAGDPALFAPLFQYNNSGYVTSLNIQNAGTVEAEVTVAFSPSGTNGTACSETLTIAPGSMEVFGFNSFALAGNECYQKNPGTRFIGSARVVGNSTSQPLVGIVNQVNFAANKGSAYDGFSPDQGSQCISLPMIQDRNSNYWTSVNVVNAGTSASDVTIEYSNSTITDVFTLVPGESRSVFNYGQLGVGYVGSATVRGSNAGDLLLVIVNQVNTVDTTHDTLYTYSGFPIVCPAP